MLLKSLVGRCIVRNSRVGFVATTTSQRESCYSRVGSLTLDAAPHYLLGRFQGLGPYRIQSFASSNQSSSSSSSNSNNNNDGRPFRILGIQQIAIGSEDRSGLSRLWQDIFGLKTTGTTHRMEKENVEEDILQLGPAPYAVEVDLMTPIDPEKSPKVHKPPLNHLGLWVDDLEQAVDWMQRQGVRFTPGGIRTGAAGHNVAFIHPKGNESSPIGGNGVLIELVQAPKAVIEAFTATATPTPPK